MRKSVHLTKTTEDYIATRIQGDINFSGIINNAFALLAHIAKSEQPKLSDGVMAELCNVYKGSDLTKITIPLSLARDLMCYYGAILPRDLPNHLIPMLEQLADLSQVEQFAILDAVRVLLAKADDE